MKNILFFLALIVTFNLSAQWTSLTDVNTEVVTSNSDDIKAIGTASGKTYIVFWKVVGAPVNYELRLQVINTMGIKELGEDGILVSNTLPMSTSTAISKISIDQNDNIYIGVTGTNTGEGFAFKMDINGNHLWNPNGINLGSGYVVTIQALSNGEAVIAWYADGQTLMQKYTANGSPIWSANQQVSNGLSGNKAPGDLFELSNNEFVLIFHVITSQIYSNLYAQKYDASGSPQWVAPIQLSNKTTTYNSSYSSAKDNDVIYYGYKANGSNHFDSYLQRINSDGTLPWGINGMDFDVNQTDYEMDTKIAFAPGSQFVWSICNYTNTGQSSYGVSIQKFDKSSGDRQFTDNARVIYPIGSSKVFAGDLQLINDQAIFLMKSGMDNGASPTTLHACLLTANGEFEWPTETKPVATFSASKGRIHFTKSINGIVVAIFIEQKIPGSSRIYAQSTATDLAINDSTGTDVISACNSYTWIDGITYTANNTTATYLLSNSNGGDSLVTLNLTINTLDLSTSNLGSVITANTSILGIPTNYQWLNCASNFSPIVGATNQSFTAITNGNYAVQITQGSCTGISECTTISNVSLLEENKKEVMIFPNPSSDIITISTNLKEATNYELIDAQGRIVMQGIFNEAKSILNLETLNPGTFFIKIERIPVPFIIIKK
jgi:hypothetical protein